MKTEAAIKLLKSLDKNTLTSLFGSDIVDELFEADDLIEKVSKGTFDASKSTKETSTSKDFATLEEQIKKLEAKNEELIKNQKQGNLGKVMDIAMPIASTGSKLVGMQQGAKHGILAAALNAMSGLDSAAAKNLYGDPMGAVVGIAAAPSIGKAAAYTAAGNMIGNTIDKIHQTRKDETRRDKQAELIPRGMPGMYYYANRPQYHPDRPTGDFDPTMFNGMYGD